MPESIQHKLDRVRPPRVQITYDVEIGDAIVMKELPFVVGILADLTGNRKADLPERPDPASHNGKKREAVTANKLQLPPLRDRKYVEIDRDNFNDIMKAVRPRLSFKIDAMTYEQYEDKKEKDEKRRNKWRAVPATNAEGRQQQIEVALDFWSLDDFNPINVIKQVKELRDILNARNSLSDLLTKLDGNDNLDSKLDAVLKATDQTKLNELRQAVGARKPDGGGSDPSQTGGKS